MSEGAAQQYTDLLMSLLTKRDAVGGGALSPEEEADFAARLDYYWSAMTLAEQAAAERRFRCEA